MRGFLSFLFDSFMPPRCLGCGVETQRVPGCTGIVIPNGWPPETFEFLAQGPFARGVRCGSAEILCGPCWMRLVPSDVFTEVESSPQAGISVAADSHAPANVLPAAPFGPADSGGDAKHAIRAESAVSNKDEEQTIRAESAVSVGDDDYADQQDSLEVIAPFVINETLLAVIRFLKFEGGRRAAPPLGWWMAAALDRAPRVPEDAVLVPVPLHGARHALRGYNQAELLAAAVAAATGLPLQPKILRRNRNTRPQSKLGSTKRADNVRGAFVARHGAGETPRYVILVDDLVTTGATVSACAAALRAVAPVGISVLAAGAARNY